MIRDNRYLFVYGSLRRGFHNPVYQYISQYFTFKSMAKVRGRLYDLGDYPAARPSSDDAFIIGELYEVNYPEQFSYAIAQLDDYEGVYAEADETPLYTRALTEAYIDDTFVNAWIYWYNRDVSHYPVVASGDVLQYLQEKNKG